MLDIKVNCRTHTLAVRGTGTVKEYLTELALIINDVYRMCVKSSPVCGPVFREMMRAAMSEDSVVWETSEDVVTDAAAGARRRKGRDRDAKEKRGHTADG